MRTLARLLGLALVVACGDDGVRGTEPHAAAGGSGHEAQVAAEAVAAEGEAIEAAVARLRAFEARERAAADFARLPPAGEVLGADPYRLVALDERRAVGILRGAGEVVLYERDADHAFSRRSSQPFVAPTGLAVCDGRIHVVGELSTAITTFKVTAEGLQVEAALEVPGAVALRDVACAGAVVHVVDEATDRVTTVAAGAPVSAPVCEGPLLVERSGAQLLVACLVDHTVLIRPVDARGLPSAAGEQRIRHDGPIWGMASRRDAEGRLLLALGGVEDRPLDRSEGFFGHVDSFVFLYRERAEGVVRVAERNLSADEVVTPKGLLWDEERLVVSGYGSAPVLWLDEELVVQERRTWLPGTAALALWGGSLVAANPLFDAWVSDGSVLVPEAAPADAEARLGEALAFTTAMAPFNDTEGAHSRFTCETCHFEGYGDGRSHHTGRGDVFATTKPLYGLFNNRPHFTRALDPDLTRVAHAEFGVAGRGSGHDPWFALDAGMLPWLAQLGAIGGSDAGAAQPGQRSAVRLPPEVLRRSLLRFLMAFNHRPNPRAARAGRFDAAAQQGAALFRDRCERCHAARLSTDDPATAVPFEAWERHVVGGGAIVWARPGYEKTGVTPYVHAAGARPPSLRRLYRKRPYFTNGAARSLEEVLARVAFHEDAFFHDGAPAGAVRLSEQERAALLAFLELL